MADGYAWDSNPELREEAERQQEAHRKARANGHNGGGSADKELRLIHFNEMRAQLNSGYIIKHLLGSTGMAVIYGEPGVGKTFFALWLALCVAAGFIFFGRRVRRCGVIYIAAEAGGSIENRAEAAKRGFDFPADMPFAAITSPINLCSNDADLERLVSVICLAEADFGMPVGLIVIDTLSRVLAGGNENGPDGMGAVVYN